MDVALFITCLTDQFQPRVGVAVIRILEAHGCRIHFPTEQTCCGQPFFNNGYTAEATQLARRMLDIFRPYPLVVTPSASCCAMVREHFPVLFSHDAELSADARDLAERTYEFSEFLTGPLGVDLASFRLPARQRVSYHYTCHLRGLGIPPAAGDGLARMGNLDYRPLKRADQCCGFGGTFALKYPAISKAMVDDKADCIGQCDAETLVCSDAGCAMNIGGMLHRRGADTRVVHLAELIAEAMGLDIDRL